MYVTSAILKGIKADATEIFMNKKRIFSYMQNFFSNLGHCLLEWPQWWSFDNKIKLGVNFCSKISFLDLTFTDFKTENWKLTIILVINKFRKPVLLNHKDVNIVWKSVKVITKKRNQRNQRNCPLLPWPMAKNWIHIRNLAQGYFIEGHRKVWKSSGASSYLVGTISLPHAGWERFN